MLARRVSKTPSEVVAFLASRQIMVDDSANGRLEEAHVRLVLETFAPEELTNLATPPMESGQVQTETPTTDDTSTDRLGGEIRRRTRHVC
ncbi:MAG TPA: hypothetical protein DCE81_00535 [Cytophagales bacterium]|nr:hypothetical protein [Cytophagales bacterium]